MIDSVRSGLVPIITRQPGFVSYQAFQADERTAVGVTTWRAREQGEAQRGSSLGWIQQSLGDLIDSFEVHSGDIELSA
jgi:hypothetical protein